MSSQRFYKRERLCSQNDIDRLFAAPTERTGGNSLPAPHAAMAYPWRAVWLPNTHGLDFTRLLIMVPKRRLRHAVDRAAMRRRLREAYRLNRESLDTARLAVDLALVYVADRPTSVAKSASALKKIFKQINDAIELSNQILPGNETPSSAVGQESGC